MTLRIKLWYREIGSHGPHTNSRKGGALEIHGTLGDKVRICRRREGAAGRCSTHLHGGMSAYPALRGAG
ncbi:MAG: hypothetical protein L0H15_05300 [Nitrosospira sp.]|nr:hypothetical protein [Nitrosospira sp.]